MRLSVIIVVPRIDSALRDCIGSLNRLAERPDIELILVARAGPSLANELRTEFPTATTIQSPPGSSLSAARAAGRARATGTMVAFLGERYQVREGWARTTFNSFERSPDVLVGGVELNVGASWAAKAIYLWEYGHLLPPVPSGQLGEDAARLAPGGNACYCSEVLREEDLAGSFWELDYHAALVRRGARFRMEQAMTVDYTPPPLGRYLRERYEISNGLTACRVHGASRLTASLRSLLLPPVRLARSFGQLFRRAGGRRDWLTSLPLFLTFALVQAAGELAGGLSSGSARHSCWNGPNAGVQ